MKFMNFKYNLKLIDTITGSSENEKCDKQAFLKTHSKLAIPSLCNRFCQLNISKPSTSHHPINPNLIKPSKSYLPRTSILKPPRYCVPLRNKFSDCAFEEEINTTEQPIDYSRKYAEIKPPTEYVVSKNEITKNEKDFGVYAETDLDQPTDYSLQYAEDDSDSDICDKMSKNEGGEFLQDTVKTYCTEGTPYQTPFNFSTATSMSDLRGEELVKQKQMDELKEFQESKR